MMQNAAYNGELGEKMQMDFSLVKKKMVQVS